MIVLRLAQDLISDGLYGMLAVAFVSGDNHRKVSYSLLAKELGAKPGQAKAKSAQGGSEGSLRSGAPGSGAPGSLRDSFRSKPVPSDPAATSSV